MTSGVILINKPRGLTSNKVVNIVKYFVGAKKAGHLGTLDKLGEGLLPVTINGATKLFGDFLDKDKEYVATFKFGEETPSFDLETEITRRENVTISKQQIENILSDFVGEISQMPPKYSAKNVNGTRAYTLIQENKDFELKPKNIHIYNLELLEEVEKNMFRFKIHCSSGTYIRSLCRDMATKLSTCGVMYDITRTRCGVFDIENAVSLNEVEKGNFEYVSLDKLFDYPVLTISKGEKDRVLQGVKIARQEEERDYKVFVENEFFGIGYVVNGQLRMRIKA